MVAYGKCKCGLTPAVLLKCLRICRKNRHSQFLLLVWVGRDMLYVFWTVNNIWHFRSATKREVLSEWSGIFVHFFTCTHIHLIGMSLDSLVYFIEMKYFFGRK